MKGAGLTKAHVVVLEHYIVRHTYSRNTRRLDSRWGHALASDSIPWYRIISTEERCTEL